MLYCAVQSCKPIIKVLLFFFNFIFKLYFFKHDLEAAAFEITHSDFITSMTVVS